MTMLTAAKARQNFGQLLDRAIRGEEIGSTLRGKVVALRPLDNGQDDYACQEYGIMPYELRRAEKKILGKMRKEKATRWDGTPHGLLG